jgi:hypothetical protein
MFYLLICSLFIPSTNIHYSIAPLLYCSFTLLLYYSITPLLPYSITPLLHYSNIHYSVTPLLVTTLLHSSLASYHISLCWLVRWTTLLLLTTTARWTECCGRSGTTSSTCVRLSRRLDAMSYSSRRASSGLCVAVCLCYVMMGGFTFVDRDVD